MSQQDQAEKFRALHVKGDPLIIYNIWNAGSAKVVEGAGAKALATGSAPVAMVNGYDDGEQIPIELALDNIAHIVEAVDLPVSMDIEGAYGEAPGVVARNIGRGISAGAIGFNFEDQIIGGEGLHDLDKQCIRLQAARVVCDASGFNAFLNARTDIFLNAKKSGEPITADMLDEGIARAAAFAKAGADGFFAPGLNDIGMIKTLCDATELPVNIIAVPGSPENKMLALAGVARISYGGTVYRQMFDWLGEQAKATFASL